MSNDKTDNAENMTFGQMILRLQALETQVKELSELYTESVQTPIKSQAPGAGEQNWTQSLTAEEFIGSLEPVPRTYLFRGLHRAYLDVWGGGDQAFYIVDDRIKTKCGDADDLGCIEIIHFIDTNTFSVAISCILKDTLKKFEPIDVKTATDVFNQAMRSIQRYCTE